MKFYEKPVFLQENICNLAKGVQYYRMYCNLKGNFLETTSNVFPATENY